MTVKQFVKSLCPQIVIRYYRWLQSVANERKLRFVKRDLFGDDADLVPPLRLMYDGPADYEEFKKNGEEYLRYYIELCGLEPSHAILDVGSGIGRKTIPLLKFLDANGLYEGIDLSRTGVAWCQRKITSGHPNFRFTLIDVHSKHYNPTGPVRPKDFRFPFQDNRFDLVVLCSVFTHMIHDDMFHYMSEIRRVLKPGGKALITFLLLNEESTALIDAKKTYALEPWNGCRVLSQDDPEHLIAHPETSVIADVQTTGLTVERILYGSWCGREDFHSFQDIVICKKPFSN